MLLAPLVAVVAVTLAGCAATETQSIPLVRVPVMAACPSTTAARGATGRDPVPSGTLLPARLPVTGALVCDYRLRDEPTSASGLALVREVRLDARSAARLAAAAAGVQVQKAPAGPTSCPADTGGLRLVALTVSRSSAVDLWWADTGCQTISRGAAVAHDVANPSFQRFQDAFSAIVDRR